jgi:hypothetical protein
MQCRDTITDEGTEERLCCVDQEGACRNAFDCCGFMDCVDGECACQARNSPCVEDTDCCEGDICVLGECVENSGCGRVGTACTGGDCCGSANCTQIGGATGPMQCCGRDGDPCEIDSECCGTMACGSDNTCECKTTGQDCIIGDCCGASFCNMPTSGANGTCN